MEDARAASFRSDGQCGPDPLVIDSLITWFTKKSNYRANYVAPVGSRLSGGRNGPEIGRNSSTAASDVVDLNLKRWVFQVSHDAATGTALRFRVIPILCARQSLISWKLVSSSRSLLIREPSSTLRTLCTPMENSIRSTATNLGLRQSLTGSETSVVDLGSQMVFPGILDLHSYPFITPWYDPMDLSLKNTGDPQRILDEVRAYAEQNLEKQRILGGLWNTGVFPNDAPKKAWLDENVPDRPVVLRDQTDHNSWLSSKALEMADITRDKPTDHL